MVPFFQFKRRRRKMADEADAKSNGLVLQSNGLVLQCNGLVLQSNGLVLQSNGLILQSNGLVLPSNGDGQGFDSCDAAAADSKSHSLHGQLFDSYDASAAGSKSHSLLLDESEDGEISDSHPDAAAAAENALPRYEYF
jgi:hypothetical protein